MEKNEFQGISDEKLLTILANAESTYASAGGHTKAHLNEWKVRRTKEEMEKRGLPIPTNKELYEIGTFNGEGAV